jgi:hypothetical protein
MNSPNEQPSGSEAIDRLIFAGHRIQAVRLICEQRGCNLPDALDALVARYRELRASRPDGFACDEEAYWAEFYS